MSRRIYRYLVPADDAAHELALTSDPVAVAATSDGSTVEFWAEHDDDAGLTGRSVSSAPAICCLTARPMSALASARRSAWSGHLYEIPA